MHISSLVNMKNFVEKYLNENSSYRILDLGSQEVDGDSNGSYRTIFLNERWIYEGADLVAGNNVDIVLKQPYKWKNIKSKTYDCVVCGQMLEHDEYFWLTMLEIRRILKPEGICCIIAPSSGAEHRYPVDCYRFYPDGLKAAARYANLEVIEVYAQWNEEIYEQMDSEWRDCVLVCRRPHYNWKDEYKAFVKYQFIQRASKDVNEVNYGDIYSCETTWKTPRPNLFSSFYYDTGKGFNQEEVEHNKVAAYEKYVHKYQLPKGCNAVRFDPVEGHKCMVKDFKVVLEKGEMHREYWECNGEQLSINMFLFVNTTDPQIFITKVDAEHNNWIEISAEIYYLD